MGNFEGHSGFTLTELLISLVVIAVGVVGFASAAGLATTGLWVGKRDTEVSLVLRDQAERLKALPPDSVQNGSRSADAYQLQWQVEGVQPKKVVLSATYPRRAGGQAADTVVVYITE